MKKAFTLIELLVVVIIISILAAIALPKYQTAVLRTRYQQLVVAADAIVKAQQVYYMANGSYATTAEELDITPPKDTCSIASTFTQCTLPDIWYEVDYKRRYRYCMARSNNELANTICRVETGGANPIFNSVYNVNYYIYP